MRFRATESRADDASETIVLVHGIGMSHRYFARLHRVLARSARVVPSTCPVSAASPSRPMT
jgi:pimeloyl-ACP methyl ester carboxylesterase